MYRLANITNGENISEACVQTIRYAQHSGFWPLVRFFYFFLSFRFYCMYVASDIFLIKLATRMLAPDLTSDRILLPVFTLVVQIARGGREETVHLLQARVSDGPGVVCA